MLFFNTRLAVLEINLLKSDLFYFWNSLHFILCNFIINFDFQSFSSSLMVKTLSVIIAL